MLYYDLLTACKLSEHLADIEKQNVTEALNAEDSMARAGRMNSLRNRAEKIVNSEIIYA